MDDNEKVSEVIGLTFKQKLQKGYVKPYRNQNYIKWVKQQVCPCGNHADDAHHVIDVGLGGMGTKASDLLTFPVCRSCHQDIHANLKHWENIYGDQMFWVAMTIEQAREEGVISL